MFQKNNLYYPDKDFKKKAWIKTRKIYRDAAENPVKFWEKLAGELFWYKKWSRGFLHQPPYFKWFLDGKINITANIFENNPAGWHKIKDKTALIWEPEPSEQKAEVLTYQALFDEVNKFANALKKLGVKKGDKVGIYLPMIPEVLISMLACVRLGAVHIVVFSAFSPAALRVRLQITEPKILITADGYYRRGRIVSLKENADEGAKETKIERIIVVKRTGSRIPFSSPRDLWWHELISRESDKCEPEIMDSEDLFFILFTSGTTGLPKGCMHICGGYAVQAYWSGKLVFDLKADDIFWCTSDPGWITGHTYTIYAPLLNGAGTLLFEGAPDWPVSDRWAQIIEKHKATIFYTAPTAIRMFEKYGKDILKKYRFESLRLLGSVGEPIDESAWLWYFREVGREKCPLVDTWWQTETGGILISSLPGLGPFRPASAGLPFPGLKVNILDSKGKPCRVGKEGSLVIQPPFAPGLLRGIYKNPEKYKETYWSHYGNKTYFTSDAACQDKNGLIRIVGRLDDVIKVAGHRLTTGELEAAVTSHPDVTECAVVGVPDELKGEAPVVFVVLRDNASRIKTGVGSVNIKLEVINQLRKAIGPIALPKEVYVVEDLPKTRSGKIMRRILRRLFSGEQLGDLSTLANPERIEDIRIKMSKRIRGDLLN